MWSSYHSIFGQIEVAEARIVGLAGRADQHLGQLRHPLTVAARIGRLRVDGARHQLDERIQKVLEGPDELLVVERDGGLRGQRRDQRSDALGKRDDLAGSAIAGVQDLKHADDVAVVVLQWNRQERLRAVSGAFVELLGAREIEFLGLVGGGDVNGFAGQGGMRRHVAVVGLASLGVVEEKRREVDRLAGRAPERDAEGIGPHDLETQRLVVEQVKGAAVGVAERLGADEDALEQALVVAFRRQRDADLDQLAIGLVVDAGRVFVPPRPCYPCHRDPTRSPGRAAVPKPANPFPDWFARRSSGSRAYPRSLGLAPPTVFSFKRIRPVG